MAGKAPHGAVLAIVAALLVVLAGCTSSGAAPSSVAAPPTIPAPSVTTPDGYQVMLDQTNAQLAAALAEIGRAPTLAVLDQSVLSAAGVASAASERLTTSGPVPATVSGDNAALAAGLRQFGRELAYLSQQVDLHAICAGPVALTAISTAPSMPGLRAVATSLGTLRTDRPAFRWGAALPAAANSVEHRLRNGQVLVDRRAGTTGDGVLQVRDQGTKDGVVLLAKGGALVASMAVTAGRSAQLAGVPDGDYDLFYTIGRDWNGPLATFSRHCEFHRFTTPTTFTTSAVSGGSAYTVQSIVLNTGTDTANPDSPVDPGAELGLAPGGAVDPMPGSNPASGGVPAPDGGSGPGPGPGGATADPGTAEVDQDALPR
ncbi:MAG TPA: hypothetical protein VH008_01005 [Pseudonocardia sp.]|jgi:hypothetical protein|nr:hypothetical protein [Pseudonocardia sp.]